MLGRKTYTQEELDHATAAVEQELAAYRVLVEAIGHAPDPGVAAALAALEPLVFNTATLALDRRFVHRIRPVTGKDGTPLNELELLAESLVTNDGVLRGNNVIKLVPAESVLKLEIGDGIALGAAEFERLAQAVLTELRAKFL